MVSYREKELIEEQLRYYDREHDLNDCEPEEEYLIEEKPEQGEEGYLVFAKEYHIKAFTLLDLESRNMDSTTEAEKWYQEELNDIKTYNEKDKYYWMTLGNLWACKDYLENII